MAMYISVPRDLTKVKTKLFFNLTKRQLICFGIGAAIGLPVFFLIKATGVNISVATMGMMAVMMPAFFLAMFEKNGQPLEKIGKQYIEAIFVRPKVRVYRTNNYYKLIEQIGKEEEDAKDIEEPV
ncbi:MAG: PrgI family protein [Pseudobutyrivibrio sp.]|nr:PrgI family protein [Pseudobutyrivibrio sp.]